MTHKQKRGLYWTVTVITSVIVILIVLGELSLVYFDNNRCRGLNAYFQVDCKSAMVFIPHQDDEIFAAGGLIYNLRQANIPVKVVFFTDGDWNGGLADIRQKEAINSCKHLLVDKNDVICLQFPNRAQADTTDKRGTSSDSLRLAMKKSIKNTIQQYKPDLLVCTDFDFHRDHRLLSILFDESVGELLKTDSQYTPIVYKGFAYQTSYYAKPDFYKDINLRSTLPPDNPQCKLYETDVPAYLWNDRVRVPLSNDITLHSITRNPIYKAINEHLTQCAQYKAPQVINGDMVFWQKRTDNILRLAKVSVSSGEAKHLNDFKLYDTNDLTLNRKNDVIFSECCWEPDSLDDDAYIEFYLNEPHTASYIVLYDDPSEGNTIKNAEVIINGQHKIQTGKIDDLGAGTVINFDSLMEVTSVKIQKIDCKNGRPSIAEVEMFRENKQNHDFQIFKIVKKETNDFIYNYFIDYKTTHLELGHYTYNTNTDSVIWQVSSVEGALPTMNDGKICFPDEFQTCKVKAHLQNSPEIYDEITITRMTWLDKVFYSYAVWYDKLLLDIEYSFYRNRVVHAFVNHSITTGTKRRIKNIFE